MNILITGGSGFIGSALCTQLLEKTDNQLYLLTRQPEKIMAPLRGFKSLDQIDTDTQFDVVVNLAGEPIADKRWSDYRKQEILRSRIDTTQQLIDFFRQQKIKPRTFISGSAIGYYGIGIEDQPVTEDSKGDASFSSQLCQQWESTAMQAEKLGIRTCIIRTGIVLGKNGGALGKMLLPFKLGLGGKIGSGQQWMPWIHLQDLVGLFVHCINHRHTSGILNGTAPNPVTNRSFTRTLGKVLSRPALLPLPATIVKLLMGQMGEELLLSGKNVIPSHALKSGYEFRYTHLEDALASCI
ncbi:MAG: hypothetical protein ACI9FD_002380 [Gammaproteobacteria bacterium]